MFSRVSDRQLKPRVVTAPGELPSPPYPRHRLGPAPLGGAAFPARDAAGWGCARLQTEPGNRSGETPALFPAGLRAGRGPSRPRVPPRLELPPAPGAELRCLRPHLRERDGHRGRGGPAEGAARPRKGAGGGPRALPSVRPSGGSRAPPAERPRPGPSPGRPRGPAARVNGPPRRAGGERRHCAALPPAPPGAGSSRGAGSAPHPPEQKKEVNEDTVSKSHEAPSPPPPGRVRTQRPGSTGRGRRGPTRAPARPVGRAERRGPGPVPGGSVAAAPVPFLGPEPLTAAAAARSGHRGTPGGAPRAQATSAAGEPPPAPQPRRVPAPAPHGRGCPPAGKGLQGHPRRRGPSAPHGTPRSN
ncbi:basic proline-rich protein-like [Vidua chalybeata]|uniref:basic proline-rich protein-like n=1 Tax=Vidua chalybeata TaxID=81927 RepID=UPI0023A89CA5|nr:basic proline-rich protein-like [Vidua chalybeata]